ncbi:MAG TPA: helix-turn-helix transcriptional regulator [Solirubrobacterales bacterium]|nr:helix-turn-helix transcriptional regulator [Solirubrobacterales bacterium]
MAATSGDDTSRIGSILKEERVRQGLEIGAVEARTKIRAKYLRAIENEDWDVLPGAAYTRGFLRTYAGILGLDAEALVDEYRARFEEHESQPVGIAEPVLRGGIPREGERPRIDRRLVVGLLVAGLAVLLLVLGLTGGSDEEKGEPAAQRKNQPGHHKHKQQNNEPVPDTVKLDVTARSDSEVCLVSQGGAVLLDNKLMETGDEETFESDTFDLSLGFGAVELSVNDESQRLRATPDAPLTWEIAPRGVRAPVADPDPDCP